MDDAAVLRLFRFRPAHAEFDQVLRAEMLPDLRRLPGVLDVYVGRHGSEGLGDRIVASIWADRPSMVAGVGESLTEPIFHPDRLPDTADRSLEIYDLAIALRFELATPPTVLRVFRGGVRPGELDAYVEEARDGTLGDAHAGRGPNALYLALVRPDGFVTMSLWRDWAGIEVATGGDVHRPITTRDPRRIISMDVAHYEVVTDAP